MRRWPVKDYGATGILSLMCCSIVSKYKRRVAGHVEGQGCSNDFYVGDGERREGGIVGVRPTNILIVIVNKEMFARKINIGFEAS